ncbi:general secretion pathway protein GspM [Vibrio sp. 10N.286.49.B3]|uniref:type II secretion system protein M n=1 Tax=Vibrio sp. 10N.286.49.B3 TaxID=1880855 RepID=UPI000C83AFDD|nr:type II secretion system protein M [Vibrio sp. 10N.286.49.B3]PMH46027.1 general secretion pathway protein GspM [Vibrio sp. 10N.286.49.B3]
MKALLVNLQTWWSSISQREQRLVMGGGILLLIGSVYWGVLQPLQQRADLAQQRIQSEKQLVNWVTNKADDIVALRQAGGVQGSIQPMNQVIDSSSRRFNIELIRVQPRGEMLQVWIKPTSFDQLINWLAYLKETQRVDVEFLDVDKGKAPGVVEVNRLQFKRGS